MEPKDKLHCLQQLTTGHINPIQNFILFIYDPF